MAEILLLIATVANATDKIIVKRLLEFGDRFRTNHQNKIKWTSLAKSYKTFGEGINVYESAIESALSADEFFSTPNKQQLKMLLTNLDNITNDIQSNLPPLKSRLQQGSNPSGSTGGSASNTATEEDQPPNYQNRVRNWLWKFKKPMLKLSAMTYARSDEELIKYLEKRLKDAEAQLNEGMKLIEDKFGIFKPYRKRYIRDNNIYLDYTYTDQDDSSHEAKLKYTLLNPPNIGSSTTQCSITRTICVKGQGGMGKTTVLKDICTQGDIRKKFRDGIHFMTLGERADNKHVLDEICRCLEDTGFGSLSEKLKKRENVEETAVTASTIFQEKKILLVVDDWHPEHLKYLKHIRSMLSKSMNGVLLVSSRYDRISRRCDEVLWFKELEPMGLKSRNILLKQMGNERIEKENKEIWDAIEKILQACGGIKLCLAIAGSSISARCDAIEIKRYAEDPERVSREVITESNGDEMRMFLSVVNTSLGYCSKRMYRQKFHDLKGKKREIDVRDLFKGFCVFEKQQQIPIEAISRLWDIEKYNASNIIHYLSECSVLRVDKKECVDVHDKVMDVALYLAEKDGEDKNGIRQQHERILRGYVSALGRESHEEEERGTCCGETEGEQRGEEMCWDVFSRPQDWELGEEEYLVRNVCRHLEEGGRAAELWKLVANVWWTLRRKKIGGLGGLVSDLMRVKRLCEGGRREGEVGDLLNREEEVGVEVLMNHIRDGWIEILEDEHMIGFEIFGRVLEEDRRHRIVKEYLKSIEEEGPRPWLRPMRGGLGRVDGARNGMGLGSCVSSDCRYVVCAGDGGFEVIDIETKARWQVEGEKGDDLKCTSMCSQPLRVACGWKSGKVSIWDVEKKEPCLPLTGHDEEVECVVMSGDGNRVVSGGRDGRVRVWDVGECKEACYPLTGHDVWVKCVVMSGDGNRVVSGGDDGSIWIWDVEKGEKACDPLRTHHGSVECVGMSEDRNRIVSGGTDGSVGVWDVEGRWQLDRVFRWKARMEDEYNSWLMSIQSLISNQGEANESSICIKSLHQDNIPVLEWMRVSIANDSVWCNCSACEGDERSFDKRANGIWIENGYIHASLKNETKVGRINESWPWHMKNGETVAMGTTNGQVMICRLQK